MRSKATQLAVGGVQDPVLGHELSGDAAGAGTASAVFYGGW